MTRRRLVVLLGSALAVVGSLAAAHGLLVRSGAACPRATSAVALEAQRQEALPRLRGEVAAPSKEALGFVLGVATRTSFVATCEAAGDHCETELEGALVTCEGSQGELVARFDPSGALVGADLMRYVADAEGAAILFRELAAAEALRFGTPSQSWGSSSSSYLAEPLRQVGVAYRFVDVAVDLSATHLGPGRIAVREQVRSIPRQTARGG